MSESKLLHIRINKRLSELWRVPASLCRNENMLAMAVAFSPNVVEGEGGIKMATITPWEDWRAKNVKSLDR